MNIIEANNALSEALQAPLQALGFREVAALVFLRPRSEGIEHSLCFAPREKLPGVFAFGCGVGIRFCKIADVVGSQDALEPTIGMPIHLLRPEKAYFEWEFSRREHLPVVVDSVSECVRAYAMPFLERFSSLPAVRQALESEVPRDYFVLTAERRVIVLAGLISLINGRHSALQFLTQELSKRAGRPAKYRTELLLMKARLEAMGNRKANP